jgi:hypothetical protein
VSSLCQQTVHAAQSRERLLSLVEKTLSG